MDPPAGVGYWWGEFTITERRYHLHHYFNLIFPTLD
jgi:hypothetical protein